jgi:hypothetical protein
METGQGHYGKGETAGREGQEVVCVKPAPLRLYPSPVSIKDRSVGPHEQVLNVPIACRLFATLASLVN